MPEARQARPGHGACQAAPLQAPLPRLPLATEFALPSILSPAGTGGSAPSGSHGALRAAGAAPKQARDPTGFRALPLPKQVSLKSPRSPSIPVPGTELPAYSSGAGSRLVQRGGGRDRRLVGRQAGHSRFARGIRWALRGGRRGCGTRALPARPVRCPSPIPPSPPRGRHLPGGRRLRLCAPGPDMRLLRPGRAGPGRAGVDIV